MDVVGDHAGFRLFWPLTGKRTRLCSGRSRPARERRRRGYLVTELTHRVQRRFGSRTICTPMVVTATMADITPDRARSFFSRWELVREMETKELQRTSVETKLQQLAALMVSGQLFAPDPNRETQADQVREKWVRLRKALGG